MIVSMLLAQPAEQHSSAKTFWNSATGDADAEDQDRLRPLCSHL
jgi:hypothetical protein